MKENSKEKLERQLNDNPELKERFNLQMKSITESVKENTAPFEGLADSVKALENLSSPLENIMNSFKAITPITSTQSIVESLELFNMRFKPLLDSITSDEHKEMVLLMDKTKIEYTSLRKSEREFIEHERLYIPNDVYEFLDWYLYCYLFDKHLDTRKEEELTLYHFNLFYKFKQRYKTHKKWDIENEREFIKEYESLNSDNNAIDKLDWDFTALQWGAIFYYADTTKLLTGKNITDKLEAFHKKHNINITVKYFRQKYYKAVDQLNKCNNYPIEKLEAIIPFLEQHYKHTVTKVKNDIEILQDYKDEYE